MLKQFDFFVHKVFFNSNTVDFFFKINDLLFELRYIKKSLKKYMNYKTNQFVHLIKVPGIPPFDHAHRFLSLVQFLEYRYDRWVTSLEVEE